MEIQKKVDEALKDLEFKAKIQERKEKERSF